MDIKDAAGNLVIAHKGRLFNEHKLGGKHAWTDDRVRQHYRGEKLVGKDVFRKTKLTLGRQTGKKRVVHLPETDSICETCRTGKFCQPLSDAVKQKLGLGAASFGSKAKDRRKNVRRVDLYPKVLIWPICGCCGSPMRLPAGQRELAIEPRHR